MDRAALPRQQVEEVVVPEHRQHLVYLQGAWVGPDDSKVHTEHHGWCGGISLHHRRRCQGAGARKREGDGGIHADGWPSCDTFVRFANWRMWQPPLPQPAEKSISSGCGGRRHSFTKTLLPADIQEPNLAAERVVVHARRKMQPQQRRLLRREVKGRELHACDAVRREVRERRARVRHALPGGEGVHARLEHEVGRVDVP